MQPSVLAVLFTPPAGGKGTQLKALKAEYASSVFGTGEYIRNNIPHNSELAQWFSESRGASLLPDRLILPPTIEWLRTEGPKPTVKVLDGLPRNIPQCQIFDFVEEFGIERAVVIHLDVPLPVCDRRMFTRAAEDPNRRHELDPAVRINRLKEYNEETLPVLDHVSRNHRAQVFSIETDGVEDPSKITRQIRGILGHVQVFPTRVMSPWMSQAVAV